LEAAGLETDLAGEVELLWNEGEALPRSRGVIRLPEGTFEAYGQNLEIENGEIILSNQPITDPRLDIDAVREVFGDPAVERAGVSIRGNAQAPVIQLFTDPPTSEEKALAYVLTGADFDHAGGQGAVNVGLYLLPKLFVSYGIGLFESGNVLSGRYELSRRWGVRVVSGERDTGVDLSYAVDR
ncbi:MAG: translocation/assembly module TamB domain-containing protein, partial [Pseudomonadota bacterium]